MMLGPFLSAMWVLGSRLLRPDAGPFAPARRRTSAEVEPGDVADDSGFLNSVSVYAYKGRVYVPKMARVKDGAHTQLEPVLKADLSDGSAFVAVIAAQLDGRLTIMQSPRDVSHRLLEQLPLRSWRQVYRLMGYYSLSQWTDRWTMETWKPAFEGRGMDIDETSRRELAGSLTVEEAALAFHAYIEGAGAGIVLNGDVA